MHISYTLGWLRTEENNYLAVPPSVARELPRRCQEILGYAVHDALEHGGGYLGMVALRCGDSRGADRHLRESLNVSQQLGDRSGIALCLEGQFQEARSVAGSGVRLEEVGAALAVLGEFDAARSVASDPALEAFRQRGVRFVLVIELFRRGRVDEAGLLLAEFEFTGLGAWERVHLALGFAGRVPWGGYPFPDW